MKQQTKKITLTIISLTLIFILAFSLAGCSAAAPKGWQATNDAAPGTPPDVAYDSAAGGMFTDDMDYKENGAVSEETAPMAPDAGNIETSAPNQPVSEPISPNGNLPNRKIIWYVDLQMETLGFDESMSALDKAIAQNGGYVEASNISGGMGAAEEYYGQRTARITARIPSDKLDAFLSTVNGIANVTSSDKSSRDITLQYADNEARKAALEVEYDRLLALLEKAESLEAVIGLEARLSEVRYELDSISSALRQYDSLVEYSTVTMNLYEVKLYTPTPVKTQTVWERIKVGFADTMYDLKDGGEDFIVGFVVNLPYLIIWAVVITVIVLVIRALIKKGKKKSAAKKALAAQNTIPQETPAPADENK